ncbi:MAG: protein kinase family protein [Tatlockia sp.]|nr:protein kinase family protein [Tatlockia sp.]
MTIEINLKKLDREKAKLLFNFFEDQSKIGKTFWQKSETFTFTNGRQFKFKNDTFQRDRNEGKIGVRYEAISNKEKFLGKGSFGKVAMIKGTLALNEAIFRFKKEGKDGKRRVVKIQKHKAKKNPLENLQNEYELSNRAGDLAIKQPTVVEISERAHRSYMVMDKLAGRELWQILDDDIKGIEVLTTKQRYDLSKALLIDLKERVTDKGIIHGDIKPENIFVNLIPTISATIFDFGLARDAKMPEKETQFTPSYFAPEVLLERWLVTSKADVFSMARVLALVWRVDLATYDPEIDLYESCEFSPSERLEGLFHGITDMDSEEKENIRSILSAMLQIDPKNRITLDEAINSFPSAPFLSLKSFFKGFSFFEDDEKSFNFKKVEDSWFSDDQQFEIQKAIWQLQKEIDSIWPYPNKDRKKEKIKGLQILLAYSQDQKLDINQAIIEVEKICPEFRIGTLSKRTANLMETLGAEPLSLNHNYCFPECSERSA